MWNFFAHEQVPILMVPMLILQYRKVQTYTVYHDHCVCVYYNLLYLKLYFNFRHLSEIILYHR